MSEITGALSYMSYHLEVQVPVLTIDAPDARTGPLVTVAARVHVPTALVRHRDLLWQSPPGVTREHFMALLDDYVRLAILQQLGVETTPLVVGASTS